MLLHLRQILTADEITRLRELAARATWTDGRATAADAKQKHNEQVDVTSAEGQAAGELVRKALGRHTLYGAAALPARMTLPMLNRYSGGMEYGAHVDASIMGSTEPLRTDLSATLFLSDPADYEGGELVITDPALGQQSAKLPAGDLLLYPASGVHYVAPVRRGARVAVIFWVQSMIRDAQQRALLLELSQALSNLQPTLAQSPEYQRINACYHNLVRMWAQP